MNPCMEWSGPVNNKGYGRRSQGGRWAYVHRLAWEESYGPIPPGLFVLHHCDNPLCYDDDHLFLGDQRDNLRDMAAKGRSAEQAKTHCPQGHLYTPENTMKMPSEGRRCRICRNGYRAALARANRRKIRGR